MIDFASALYLGMHHSSGEIPDWSSLTSGRPAMLAEPADSRSIAHRLALLQGRPAAVLGSSTLHLFWDLFGMISAERSHFLVDRDLYPVARWGVERVACRGAPLSVYRHLDAGDLGRRLDSIACARRPVVVTDGCCPLCGRVAPLGELLEHVAHRGGVLIVDDTQGLGLLGRRDPWDAGSIGTGGGGSLRWCGIDSGRIIVVSSLAKAFGVPIAVLTGASTIVDRFIRSSSTRVHCSPPSQPVLLAARHALDRNQLDGDALRSRLRSRIELFGALMLDRGIELREGMLPLRTLGGVVGRNAQRLHCSLMQAGIHSLLHRGHDDASARLSFIVTVDHSPEMLERAADRIEEVRWRLESRGSRVEGRESRVESRESRVESRGSRVESRESRVESRGSRVESRGSIV